MSTGPKIHTHYDNLKVARDAPEAVIRAAYKALSQQYHPDKHGGDPAASNIMRLINEAYVELSDPVKRRAHDVWIAKQEASDRPNPTRPTGSPPPSKPPATPTPTRSSVDKGSNWKSYAFFLLLLGLIVAGLTSGKSSPPSPKPATVGIPNPNRAPTQAQTPEAPAAFAFPRPANHGRDQAPATEGAFAGLLPRGRVTAPELNVRAGPTAKDDVLARLRFLDTVSIEGPAEGRWIPISHRAGFGYVNNAYIQVGSDRDTLRALCSDNELPPTSGTLLKRPDAPGDHELRIRAPDDGDTLVKLKDSVGRTAFSGYVRRGEAHTFRGIPTGRYFAWFATGGAYSAKCGRFLPDMTVTYDPTPQEFRTTHSAGLTYSTIIEYSLQRQRNGNFSASRGDIDAFVAD